MGWRWPAAGLGALSVAVHAWDLEGGHLYLHYLHHSLKVKVRSLSRVQLFATLWTVGHQAPASMGFPRQEYWSGLPFPSPGDLPDPGIEPGSPALQADALTSEPPGKPLSKTVNKHFHYRKKKKCKYLKK